MFISYAQNLEDVILFRALQGVEKGFYIDVGAQDPMIDSVTKAFYERGWRGINIEPVEHWFQKLVADRPEDINLQLAAASQSGEIRFYEVRNTGLSTADPDFAFRHAVQGYEVREQHIAAKALDAICTDCGVTEVHFLKVDVEGAEADVLRGLGLIDFRPWIIFVEATEPNSQSSTHEQWEDLLTTRAYEFVYFDGLNRFYVAEEHASLKGGFSAPPNWFDSYIRYSEWSARQHATELENDREVHARQLDDLGKELMVVRHQRDDLIRQRDGLQNDLTKARELQAQELSELRKNLTAAYEEGRGLRDRLDRAGSEREILVRGIGRLLENMDVLRREAQVLRVQISQQNAAKEKLERSMKAVYGSTSWRITAPLRFFRQTTTSAKSALRVCIGVAVHKAKRGLRLLALCVWRRGFVTPYAKALLGHFPALQSRIRRFLSGDRPPSTPVVPAKPEVPVTPSGLAETVVTAPSLPSLSASAREVLRVFREVRALHQKVYQRH